MSLHRRALIPAFIVMALISTVAEAQRAGAGRPTAAPAHHSAGGGKLCARRSRHL